MRWLLTLLVLAGLPALLVWIATLTVEDRPLVAGTWQPTASDIRRAKSLIRAHDPRSVPAGEVRTVRMSERDLNLALNHAINLVGRGTAVASVRRGVIDVQGTLALPPNPLGGFFNVAATFRTAAATEAALPALAELRLGSLDVPPAFANWVLGRALERYYGADAGQVPIDPVELVDRFDLEAGRLTVVYRWPEGTLDRLRSALVGEDDRRRFEAYQAALHDVTARHTGQRIRLVDLLRPLFVSARERSAGGDAAQENRALVVVLAAYVNGRDLAKFVSDSQGWPTPRRLTVTIQGRRDFSQHFLVSAALTALGGGALSDAIGLYKEVDDSRGGSGFSFTDLAADRAGTRFGEIAVSGEAGRVQNAIAEARDESAIMPEARDLPEHLSETEFERRYGSTESAAYRRVTQEIEARIARIALYQ